MLSYCHAGYDIAATPDNPQNSTGRPGQYEQSHFPCICAVITSSVTHHTSFVLCHPREYLPTNNSPEPKVNNYIQIKPAFTGMKIRYVTCPFVIRVTGVKALLNQISLILADLLAVAYRNEPARGFSPQPLLRWLDYIVSTL